MIITERKNINNNISMILDSPTQENIFWDKNIREKSKKQKQLTMKTKELISKFFDKRRKRARVYSSDKFKNGKFIFLDYLL